MAVSFFVRIKEMPNISQPYKFPIGVEIDRVANAISVQRWNLIIHRVWITRILIANIAGI